MYAVSRVERYLECPFKYFAGQVLQLEEEREDESGLTPLERGQLLHGVFEAFFEAWRARGRSGVSADDLDEALALFEDVAEAAAAARCRRETARSSAPICSDPPPRRGWPSAPLPSRSSRASA